MSGKYHSGQIRLTHEEDMKLKIKSKNKQTTLTSSVDALAFPHSPSTLKEWHNRSLEINDKIRPSGIYKLENGKEIESFANYEGVDTTDLFEALRCVNMNNQKLNEFTFAASYPKEPPFVKPILKVITGDELKGKTEHEISFEDKSDSYVENDSPFIPHAFPFTATFGGGLDHILKLTTAPKVNLRFIDLSQYGQGMKLIMEFPATGDVVLQSAIKVK